MSNIIKLKKGLDIKLKGKAEKVLKGTHCPSTFAIKPTDFPGLTPKLLVKEGESVKAGTPLFRDKYTPDILFASPVSGTVKLINRGERRRILEVVIESDGNADFVQFSTSNVKSMSKDDVKQRLLEAGAWPYIQKRPFGIIANPNEEPKNIFVSGFDSAPLAGCQSFAIQNYSKELQAGLDALSKLTQGKVYLGISAREDNTLYDQITGAEKVVFDGPHPAGNVGIQIHHISPLNKGDIVWTTTPQELVTIGKLILEGIHDPKRIIAITGSEAQEKYYTEITLGSNIATLVETNTTNENVRYISGNVLTGDDIGSNGFLGYRHNQISIIPEGDYYEAFGWALPGFGKFSPSRTFFSWLGGSSNKEYKLDTNYHGEERAFVVTGEYEKVLPMDILPVFLMKAIMTNDIDKMEQLGIYEVIEEDMALCEYACTSKIEVQTILRKGISTMIKELS